MNIQDKVYLTLSAMFTVLIVVGNLIYQKIVLLPIPCFEVFELSAGVILYPLTFLIMDLIAEFFGREKASFSVKLAIFMNVVIALVILMIGNLNATNWSRIDNNTFDNVFGQYNVAFLGSVLAFYIAQNIDIWIYLSIRKLTKGKLLWLRNNVSTAVSLLIDTTIVIWFMTFFEVLPAEQMWPLIFNSYSYKLLFVICSTPIFYLFVYLIRRLLNLNTR